MRAAASSEGQWYLRRPPARRSLSSRWRSAAAERMPACERKRTSTGWAVVELSAEEAVLTESAGPVERLRSEMTRWGQSGCSCCSVPSVGSTTQPFTPSPSRPNSTNRLICTSPYPRPGDGTAWRYRAEDKGPQNVWGWGPFLIEAR
ncbi:Hypothetical protein AA314_00083 [Archangium gephyra]|uniref:Uncharacterized protein n=1 Tax=Archangium gephyra TaxID=48 RepID=A0AAC8TA39_9BACT|nr:Hypothetical protein AA314_00083 [Archangium gephyra]